MSSAPDRGRAEDRLTGPGTRARTRTQAQTPPPRPPEALPPELIPPISAHRRLRGPYTAAGTVMRALVPDALLRFPELVAAHRVEIVSAAPELGHALGLDHAVKSATSPDQDTTRFFSRFRTLRLAHGLTEFVRDYTALAERRPATLTVTDADEADPTDQEFFAVLRRRAGSAHLTLVTAAGAAASAATSRAGTYTRACATALTSDAAIDLAAAHVRGDCLDIDPAAHAAYLKLPAALRRELHDRRAAKLADSGDYSLRLGAIPYHRERGSDPAAAVAALHEAMHYCIDLGFYHAAGDLARRGRALVGWSRDPQTRYVFTNILATAHISLAEPDDAAVLYEEIRRHSTEPSMHMSAAYLTGILLTRHLPEERREHEAARGRLNEAVAFAGLLPDSPRLALQRMFNNVGLALVENHLGNWPTALERTSDALALLPAGESEQYRLHRSVLHLRRVQTYLGMGDREAAAAEYRKVLEADPEYPEYHLEFGTMLRELGRDEEALAEYETAIRLSPPFAEAYYNRADMRAASGDLRAAAEDYRYVVELDPGNLDAHLNLASVLDELGEAQAASVAVEAGLSTAPGDPHLLCLRGQLDLAAGRHRAARAALDAATAADPGLAAAWAARGELAYATGDLEGAVADLTRAWELSEDVEILFNRAVVHQELGDWRAAIDDFDRVLEQDPDERESRLRRDACLASAAARAHGMDDGADQPAGSAAEAGSSVAATP